MSTSRVVLADGLLELVARDVGVDLGGGDVLVAQQELHRAQVGAVLQQVGGK